MPLAPSTKSRDLPIRAKTPEQEARDVRQYTLMRIVGGEYFTVKLHTFTAAEDIAETLATTYARMGVQDWALFIEDQHRLMFHHEWRNGQPYHLPYQAEVSKVGH